jgi:hypothetical protein
MARTPRMSWAKRHVAYRQRENARVLRNYHDKRRGTGQCIARAPGGKWGRCSRYAVAHIYPAYCGTHHNQMQRRGLYAVKTPARAADIARLFARGGT